MCVPAPSSDVRTRPPSRRNRPTHAGARTHSDDTHCDVATLRRMRRCFVAADRAARRALSVPRRAKRQRRLSLEPLEERPLLAVMTVTALTDDTLANLAGDGQLSLREAIQAINTGANVDGIGPTSGVFGVNDEIQFAPALFAGGTGSDQPGQCRRRPELTITRAVTITGPGAPADDRRRRRHRRHAQHGRARRAARHAPADDRAGDRAAAGRVRVERAPHPLPRADPEDAAARVDREAAPAGRPAAALDGDRDAPLRRQPPRAGGPPALARGGRQGAPAPRPQRDRGRRRAARRRHDQPPRPRHRARADGVRRRRRRYRVRILRCRGRRIRREGRRVGA